MSTPPSTPNRASASDPPRAARRGSAGVRLVGAYAVATVASAAASFAAIPLLLRALGQEEFGRWSLLEPIVAVLAPAALLGANHGVLKQVSHDRRHAATVLRAVAVPAQPALALFALAAALVARALGFSSGEAARVGLLVYAEAALTMALATARAAERPATFAAGALAKAGAIVALPALVLYAHGGARAGDVVSWRLAAALAGIVATAATVRGRAQPREAPPARGREAYADAVRYGAPILFAGLLALVIEFADRYVLAWALGYAALARYVVYVKLGSVIDPLVIAPLALWFPTARFEHLRDADGGERFFAATATATLRGLLAVAGAAWLAAPWLLRWLAPGIPLDAPALLLLLLSVVFRGMATPLNVGLLLPGRTRWNAWGVAIAAAVHVGLCVLLIPPYGILGGALATMLSYLAYAALLHALSQRVRRVRFPLGRMTMLVAAAVAELLVARAALPGESFAPSAARSLLFVGAFAVTALLLSAPRPRRPLFAPAPGHAS